jgi:TRAP-type mannitol/chloroaromatic compound transport system permease small subunit
VADAVNKATGALVIAAVAGAGLCIAAIIVVGTADTVGRLLNRPVMGAVEITEALLAAVIFLALPYAQRHNAHVVVDIVVQSFSNRWRKILYFFALVLTLAAFILLAKQSYEAAVQSWRVGEVSAGYLPIPVWLAKIMATTGLAIAVIETARQIIWAILWPDLMFATQTPASAEDVSMGQQ